MKWFKCQVHKIGDANGLMVVEVKGKDLRDAQERLVSVLFLKVCLVEEDSWEEV